MATAADPGKFGWSLKGPEADLTDENGGKIANHYREPTWEANDGSKVVGEVQKKADAAKPGGSPTNTALNMKQSRREASSIGPESPK